MVLKKTLTLLVLKLHVLLPNEWNVFSAKNRIRKQNTYTHTQSGAENLLGLVNSQAVSQLIMRVHKPKVE